MVSALLTGDPENQDLPMRLLTYAFVGLPLILGGDRGGQADCPDLGPYSAYLRDHSDRRRDPDGGLGQRPLRLGARLTRLTGRRRPMLGGVEREAHGVSGPRRLSGRPSHPVGRGLVPTALCVRARPSVRQSC